MTTERRIPRIELMTECQGDPKYEVMQAPVNMGFECDGYPKLGPMGDQFQNPNHEVCFKTIMPGQHYLAVWGDGHRNVLKAKYCGPCALARHEKVVEKVN